MRSYWLAVIASGVVALLTGSYLGATGLPQLASNGSPQSGSAERALIDRYCVTCHNDKTNTAGLALNTLGLGDVTGHMAPWEKVVQRLRTRAMPPMGLPRPDEAG